MFDILLRRPIFLLLIIEVAAIGLCARELVKLPGGKTQVAFLDVGQGDSALITTPSGKRIIIDGGPGKSLLSALGKRLPLTNRSIDLVVITHPQLDHIAALPDVIRRYDVAHILMTGVSYDVTRYRELLAAIIEKKIPIWIADPAYDIDMGDGAVLDVAWPLPNLMGRDVGKDANNSSVVLRLIHGDMSVLFTGDAEEKEERALMRAGTDVDADILKVGHHGSKTSSGTGFLLAVTPKLAVVSAGRKNSYGHPHAVILGRLKSLNIPVRVTGWEGDIDVSW